jgi:hypothetical protein
MLEDDKQRLFAGVVVPMVTMVVRATTAAHAATVVHADMVHTGAEEVDTGHLAVGADMAVAQAVDHPVAAEEAVAEVVRAILLAVVEGVIRDSTYQMYHFAISIFTVTIHS